MLEWLEIKRENGKHDVIIIIINPSTARVIGAPQMILQPVFSIFPCSPLRSGTCRTPGLSIPWRCLPTCSSVCLFFFPLSLCLAKMVLARPGEQETWPYHCSLRLFTFVRSSCGPVARWILARTSSSVTWSLYEMCSILRYHLMSMDCILLRSSAVSVHDSQAYRKMDVTKERNMTSIQLKTSRQRITPLSWEVGRQRSRPGETYSFRASARSSISCVANQAWSAFLSPPRSLLWNNVLSASHSSSSHFTRLDRL